MEKKMSNETEEHMKRLIERALSGAHGEWDTFDIEIEGVKFQELEETIEGIPFDEQKASDIIEKLKGCVKGYGYGTLDGELNSKRNKDKDENEIYDECVEAFEMDFYNYMILSSVKIIKEKSKTEETKKMTSNLYDILFESIKKGMRERLDMKTQTYEMKQ